jgi:NtrC-family two-component system sensor histidine kinase KinB
VRPAGGIKRRLWIGIGGLLLVLLMTAGLAVWISRHADAAIEQTFRNNGDSLAYMHELTADADSVDAWVRTQIQARRPGSLDAIRPLKTQVDQDISSELHNVTEKGEREAAYQLQSAWSAYLSALPGALRPGLDTGQRRTWYRARLAPAYERMRAQAWVIADLNLNNVRFKDHGQSLLASELRLMTLMLLAGVALGVAFVLRLGRSLVDPLLELTTGVRELGRGRLDGQVAIQGDDELAELGKAFNSMARRLRAYEQGFRAKLLRVQRTTQLAINSFSDPVAVLGLDRRVELCNRAAEQLFGLKPGVRLEEGPLAPLAAELGTVLDAGLSHEPTGYAGAIPIQRQGKERYILPRLSPVLDARGSIVGATLVLADVTGLRRLDEMKSGLLATVSHELKNPLTGLRMAAHLLAEDVDAGRGGRLVALAATLKDNADRMHGVLEGLLELGRLESGDLLRLELKSADEVLQDMLAPLRPTLERQGHTIELRVDSHLPPVAVDAVRLRLVFSNLLDNAARHSPPQGTLVVGARAEEGGVRFWVQDQGPGVPKRYEKHIFERFFRVPGQPQASGLGLGLTIAREITELHGGHLILEETSIGARFSFLLPGAESPVLSSFP